SEKVAISRARIVFTWPPGISSASRIAQHLRARVKHLARSPVAGDEGEHRADLGVAQLAAERRHVARITWRRVGRNEAVLRDGEKDLVRVVPGVPALVMRRGRQAAVGLALPPVRLALELRAMARRAVLRVKGRA